MKRTLVASAAVTTALLFFVLPAYGTMLKKPPVFAPKKGGTMSARSSRRSISP